MKKLILFCFSLTCFAQATVPPAGTHFSQLSWTSTATSFNVYRMTGSCPATITSTTGWAKINTTAVTSSSYYDTAVTAGTTYAYVVTAVNGSSESGPSNCAQGAIPTNFPPTNLLDIPN